MLEFPSLKNHWFVGCSSSRLRRKPLGITLLGQPIVLFRSADGQACALADVCPHRNAPLSKGRTIGGRISCPYHGWQFDGDGVCRLAPGLENGHSHHTRNASRYHVREQQGFVWIYASPDEPPRRDPYRLAHLGAPGTHAFRLQFPLTADLADALENFLDATHTHFVHHGIIRGGVTRRKVEVRVRSFPDRAEAEYVGDGQDSGIVAWLFGGGIDTSIDRFIMPSIVELEHRSNGVLRLLITLMVTPLSEGALDVHVVVGGEASLLRFFQAFTLGRLLFVPVIRQDSAILRHQYLNKRRHPDARYASTKLDIMRPHIMRLLRGEQTALADDVPANERRVDILL